MQLVKYSASGNDFIIYHSFVRRDRSETARRLCDRFRGIGADGLIVLLPHSEYDFEWEFYNADGSIATMCGNGSRAAAHYAVSFGLAASKMRFLTLAGVIEANVEGDLVESQLTKPKILRRDIYEAGLHWWLIDTGLPHLVTFVEDLKQFDKNIAKSLRQKYNANINYGIIRRTDEMGIRTFERGVEDETLACGTGMAAAFLRANEEKKVADSVRIYPKSQEELHLRRLEDRLYLKGRVEKIFETFKEGVV